MYDEIKFQKDLQFFLKGLQKFNAEADQWMSSHNSKSKREFQRKLLELKQGSMSVEEYFQEMELAKIRAGVKEAAEATMDRFVNGLNPELACFAKTLSFLDIDLLIPLVAEYEQNIKQQRCPDSSPNAKEIESLIVTIPNDELEPAKKEEELNVENIADKCVEEDLLIPSTILVVKENPLNHEKESENMSESDFCEADLERKIQFESEEHIESIECFQNKESKNESKELSEKKGEKSCEKSEVKIGCIDVSLVTNDLSQSFPPDSGVLQVFLDLFPKKPPDRFLSSRSIAPLPPSRVKIRGRIIF